jgi:DNA-binding response OmpR family regulator
MPRILVVDDQENLLKLYEMELKEDGFEVTVANNAREALEYFQRERPDLVVLDIRMPGMDGLETIGHMLAIDRSVPVIFNSAYPVYKDNFLSWLAEAYVCKSSDLTELRRKIREVLSNRTAPEKR